VIRLPLTPEQRTVYWTVTVHETYGSAHQSSGLHASAVRQQYDFWSAKPSTARMELIEHTLIQTAPSQPSGTCRARAKRRRCRISRPAHTR
jgi:hypothetical protein